MVQKSCTSLYGQYFMIFHDLQGFIHFRLCRISSINSISYIDPMFFLNWHGRPLDNQKFGFSWTQLGFWIKNPSGKQQLLRSKFVEISKAHKTAGIDETSGCSKTWFFEVEAWNQKARTSYKPSLTVWEKTIAMKLALGRCSFSHR